MAMLALLLDTIVNKWKTLPETVVNLTGRTVIITGANVGLGLEAAKRFYAMSPARLILAVRTLSKGEAAKRVIIEGGTKQSPHGTSRADTQVDVWALDLSNFESIRQFAAKCEAELDRIDILLENAALTGTEWSVTKDGWEVQVQTNILSTFFLAALLTPLIAKTSKLPVPPHGSILKPHLVVVASDTHTIASFLTRNEQDIFAALNDKSKFVASARYADTKAIDILMTQHLAKHSLVKDVVVCSVNPGFCRSELLRDAPSPLRAILYALFARTTAEGSKTYLWASLNDDISAGSYTSSCRVTQPGGAVASNDAERIRSQLWKEMAIILTEQAPQTEAIWNL